MLKFTVKISRQARGPVLSARSGPRPWLFMALAFLFTGVSDVTGSASGGGPLTLRWEPLGPSSRRTGLVISEIMYRPAPRSDGKVLEYVELFNSNPFFEEIGGY